MRKDNTSKTSDKTTHPRTHAETGKKHFSGLSNEELAAIEQFRVNIDKKLIDLQEQYQLSGMDMCDLFEPYIDSPQRLSNFAASAYSSRAKGQRHANWRIMAAMYLIFGQSIDEILSQSITPRSPEQRPDKSQLENN